MEGQPQEETAYNGNLDSLPISLPVKKLIREGETKGQRSEAIFSVLQTLLKANLDESTIVSIFETYPIGEKYRENGRSRHKWLQGEIRT